MEVDLNTGRYNLTRKNPSRSAKSPWLNTQSSKNQSYIDMQTTDNESAGLPPNLSEDESDSSSSSRQKEKLTRKEQKERLEKKRMSDKFKEKNKKLKRSIKEALKNNIIAKYEKEQLKSDLTEVQKKQKKIEEEKARLEIELKEVKEKEKEKETEDKNTQLKSDLTKVKKKQNKARLKKNINYFIWIASVLVLIPLCIGLHWAFKGHETNHHELRLMLVGKTGAGKSASGNTILGEEVFRVEASPASVTARCMKKNKVLDERNITIIDTPGVLDTWLISNQMVDHTHECVSMSFPDPHVFLLVIRLGRFTVEESNAVKWIQENFGEVALKFTIVLFTGGDLLEGKAVEKFISNSIDLQNLVDTCEGRYHVFNNYKQSNRTQVTELFKKINAMLHQNMGYFYMNEVHQMVQQRTREEEKAKRLILEKEIQTVEVKNRAMMEELIRDHELKRKQLKENITVEEKRKMNQMAVKLKDEQYENKNLKAELEHAYTILLLFEVLTGTLILIQIVLCFKICK